MPTWHHGIFQGYGRGFAACANATIGIVLRAIGVHKAIDMLEQAMAKFPVQAATPERLYRLGGFYRDANLPTRSAEASFA